MDGEWNPLDPEGGSTWSWWRTQFPVTSRIYGEPLVYGEANLDILAHALGESPLGLIYSEREGGFFFKDYLFEGAYRRTTDGRVKALIRKLVRESVEAGPKSVQEASKPLYYAAGAAMVHARIILEVDPSFWERNKRVIAGKKEAFSSRDSCKRFAEEAITQSEGQSLALREAFGVYTRYCDHHSAQPLSRAEFQKEINQHFDQKFGVRLRNDLPSGGNGTRGWTRIGLKEEFLSMTG